MILRITTTTEAAATRLDAWLAAELKYSRSFIGKLIDDGGVLINGRAVKPSHRSKIGEVVEITVPEPTALEVLPEDIPLDIVHEDDHILVVNKPQGMVVHPAAGVIGGTLVNALLWHLGGSLSAINGRLRPGIVHRLDKDTSGLLLVAKTDAAHRAVADQFARRTVGKVYHALVHGRLDAPVTINQPIARHKTHRKKMAADPAGRFALTHIRPLSQHRGYSFIEARPETGRTHQIRVHLAHIRRPILGDALYGPAQSHNLKGQALHASRLTVIHPATQTPATFTAPLPDHIERLRR